MLVSSLGFHHNRSVTFNIKNIELLGHTIRTRSHVCNNNNNFVHMEPFKTTITKSKSQSTRR